MTPSPAAIVPSSSQPDRPRRLRLRPRGPAWRDTPRGTVREKAVRREAESGRFLGLLDVRAAEPLRRAPAPGHRDELLPGGLAGRLPGHDARGCGRHQPGGRDARRRHLHRLHAGGAARRPGRDPGRRAGDPSACRQPPCCPQRAPRHAAGHLRSISSRRCRSRRASPASCGGRCSTTPAPAPTGA